MTDQPTTGDPPARDRRDQPGGLAGVERVGDILARHPTARRTDRHDGDTEAAARPAAVLAVPAVTAPGACPTCAAERTRVWRPGAPEDRPQLTSRQAAADLLVPLLEHLDREHCVTLNLDSKHRLLAATTVSIGSVDHTFMGPREVYRDALVHGAAAIVVAHNHPSGDAEPSRDDEHVTRRLARAGDILGVEVLDHLVIGHHRWTSLARRGVLSDARSDQWTLPPSSRAR